MTTERDHGGIGVRRIECPLDATGVYHSRVLAVRDMRIANGRDPLSGEGGGNGSWVGLALAMVVLDTLTPESQGVRARWRRLLTENGIGQDDGDVIYELRCSLLHGYGVPRPETIGGRRLLLTDVPNAYALDTRDSAIVTLSVPIFCGGLVERIVTDTPEQSWDTSRIDVAIEL